MKRIVSIFSFLLLMWGTMVAQTTTYYVTATTLNVRNKPQPNATIVGKLTQGMCIQVWEITNGWAYITAGKTIGYVSAQYISRKRPSANNQTPQPAPENNSAQSRSTAQSAPQTTPSSSSPKSFPYMSGDRARYSGYVDGGLGFRSGMAGFSVDVINGCAIRDYIFVGGGVGLHGMFGTRQTLGVVSVPFYAYVRGRLRVNKNFAPYADFGIGGYAGWAYVYNISNSAFGGDFYARLGAGIQIFNAHIGIGYERCAINQGYLRVGYSW